jgi:hypothetical protein
MRHRAGYVETDGDAERAAAYLLGSTRNSRAIKIEMAAVHSNQRGRPRCVAGRLPERPIGVGAHYCRQFDPGPRGGASHPPVVGGDRQSTVEDWIEMLDKREVQNTACPPGVMVR